MKTIGILKDINKAFMMLTVVLYFTIFLGLIFQVVLGGYQVIIALVLLFYWKGFSKKIKNKLLIYWGVVLVYGICYITGFLNLTGAYWFISFAIVPILIALYFSLFLEDIKQEE